MAGLHKPDDEAERDDSTETIALDTCTVMSPLKPDLHGFNMYDRGLGRHESPSNVQGMVLIEPMQLFNIMMKIEADKYPAVADPNYLLLLDARRRDTYDQSHISLAKFTTKSSGLYELPYGADVETKRHVIVYDDLTDILRFDNGKRVRTDATKLAKVIYSEGARKPVKILRGGYILFSKLYPFLRTTDIVYVPRHLDNVFCYPCTVISHKLYLGTRSQCNSSRVQQDLKLTAFVNCCKEAKDIVLVMPVNGSESTPHNSLFYESKSRNIPQRQAINLHLPKHDDDSDLHLEDLNRFMAFLDDNDVVIVYDTTGTGRAAALCMAYMMYKTKSPLLTALQYFQECEIYTVPSERTLIDLHKLETAILDRQVTELRL